MLWGLILYYEQVKNVKLLGVTVDKTLSIHFLNIIYTKNVMFTMNSEITNIRKSTYLLNDTTVKLLIKSLVLSHLDYCSTVWSCAPKTRTSKTPAHLERGVAPRSPLRSSVACMTSCLGWWWRSGYYAASFSLWEASVFNARLASCLCSCNQQTISTAIKPC